MQYYLETFLTQIVGNDIHYKQVKTDITNLTDNPDDLVILSVQKYSKNIVSKSRLISHSTSWRYLEGGTCFITYIVYSDDFDIKDEDSKSFPISKINIVESGDLTHPAPKSIPEESVVSHGIRHLSFLISNNPLVYEAVVDKKTFEKFQEINTVLAGKI